MSRYAKSITARKEIFAMGPLQDLKQLLERSCILNGDKRAIVEKTKDGSTISHSCIDLRRDVNALGTVLLEMGLKGKKIALVGENSYKWIAAYLAVVCGVGVIVPLDKELADKDIQRLIDAADVEAVFYSKSMLPTIRAIESTLPNVRAYLPMDHVVNKDLYYNMDMLIQQGESLISAGDTRYLDAKIDPEVVSAILFTSGTTGANKGVMLSQKNICFIINNAARTIPSNPDSLSVLPMNHSFEFNTHVLTTIYGGIPLCINDSLRYLMDNLKLFKPGMSIVVPLFLNTIHKNVWQQAKKLGTERTLKLAIMISKAFLKVGIDLRSFLFRSIKEVFGGDFTLLVCGGAPTRKEIVQGLNDIGFEVILGYGITECAPLVSVNLNTLKDPSSVGKPIEGVQVKIGEPNEQGIGEILVKGDNVMLGYYKDEAATAASFEDGWFKTGDYGLLNKKGELLITGRKKNLIILNNGKNVHPEEIEDVIQEQLPYALEVLVHEIETSLRMPNKVLDAIGTIIHIDEAEYFSHISRQEIERQVIQDLQRINRTLPVYKQIHYLSITGDEFEKTTTKKIIRQQVIVKHQDSDRVVV